MRCGRYSRTLATSKTLSLKLAILIIPFYNCARLVMLLLTLCLFFFSPSELLITAMVRAHVQDNNLDEAW